MTVNDIYTQALGITAQRVNDSDLSCFAVGWINLLLTESLAAENSVRLAAGEAPLACAPVLASLADETPYCAEITGGALPFGMASFLYEAADDGERARDYRARYVQALWEASKGVSGGTDVYAGLC